MKKLAICVALVLLFLAAMPRLFAQALSKQKSSHVSWNLEIDQPIQQLEEILKTTDQQQPANYTISNIAFLYDAKLYILFQKYLETLSSAKQAEAWKDQEQWLKKQKKAIDVAYAGYEGGSYATYSAGEASIKITKLRIAEIESRLKNPPK
jgi:uncharacterized protein YecT (DUF1311 family)